jgi:hypothetical protein
VELGCLYLTYEILQIDLCHHNARDNRSICKEIPTYISSKGLLRKADVIPVSYPDIDKLKYTPKPCRYQDDNSSLLLMTRSPLPFIASKESIKMIYDHQKKI